MNLTWFHAGAFAAVVLCWIVFAAIFTLQKKPGGAETKTVERVSLLGIVIQGFGFATAWMVHRLWFSPIVPLPGLLQVIPDVLAVALSVLALFVALNSIRALGKEWSFEARLVEGHRLVTAGPYGWVRHPIYAAMLGMLVATALVVSHWIGLLAAVTFFAIGTTIRIRSEERLLRNQFGEEFEAYARRVPAILPGLARR
jgi:protein-S-isoprenylcysteine O-methyltransferase Ste14